MSDPFQLEAIIAIADNNAIGLQGKLPWHIPSELALFKSITSNAPLIMGRGTYESLPGILPNRHHIIITSSSLKAHSQICLVNSLQEAIECARTLQSNKAFVIGGRKVFDEALSQCAFLHRTRVHVEPKADTFYSIDEHLWNVVSSKKFVDEQTAIAYTYDVLERNY